MSWTRPAAPFAVALALLPHATAAQVVVRDDVDGWGWLALLTDRPAIVQLAFASSQSTQEGRLDEELMEVLRAQGLQRIAGQGDLDPAKPQVLVECTGTDWLPERSPQIQIAMHVEVSAWDQPRLAATEIYEALSIGSAAPEMFSTELYVEGCARLLVRVLTRLGFDQS